MTQLYTVVILRMIQAHVHGERKVTSAILPGTGNKQIHILKTGQFSLVISTGHLSCPETLRK